jgi:AraC-like DNA-binding protein
MDTNLTHYDKKNPLLMTAEILLGSQEAANELGLDLEPSLELAKIDRRQLVEPDQFLPLHKIITFFNDAAERSRCDYFGFLVAQHQPPSRFASVGQLVRFASTLGEAIKDAIHFALLNSEFSRWELDLDGEEVSLIRRTRVAYDEPMIQLQILALTVVYKAMAGLTGNEFAPTRVCFAVSPFAYKHKMEAYFRAPVHFNQPANAIVFPHETLGIPILSADAQVYALIRSQLTSLSQGVRRADDVVARVVHHIQATMGSRYCSLEFIAERMGIHPRALQRQLAAKEASFKILLNRVRQGLAEEYLLNSSISVTELSEFLGYRNASAFSRAFKREAGVAPGHWKLARHAEFVPVHPVNP